MTTPSTTALSPGTLGISADLNLVDFAGQPCTSFAFPKDPDVATDTPWETNEPDFAAGRFYCLLAKNTFAPNSVQGAYYQDKGFICLLEKSGLAFDGQPHNVTFDFSDQTCFSDDFRTYSFNDGVPPPFQAEAVASVPSAIAPESWDKSVVVTLPNMGKINMLFRSTETVVASAVYMEVDGQPGSAYAMSLDIESGTLRIDRRGMSNKNGELTRRAYRLLVRGDIKSDGAFERVDAYQGIDVDVFIGESTSIALHSIRGSVTQGYRTQTRACSTCTDLYDLPSYLANSASTACYPGSDGVNTCTDVAPIAFDTVDTLKFIPDQTRNDFEAFSEWYKRAPLAFDEVQAVQVQ